MKKIPSFTVNHLVLEPGIYISRTDRIGERSLITYDLRMTRPNREPVMNTAEIHTIEHLGATFLRNHSRYSSSVIYFGPMGCRTGFYLILADGMEHEEVLALVKDMYAFIARYEGDIPGAAARDCGNYLDQNLAMARYHASRYYAALSTLEDCAFTYKD